MQSYWLLIAIGAGLISNVSNFLARHIVKNDKDILAFSFFLEAFKIVFFVILALFDFRFNLTPITTVLLIVMIISEPISIFLYMKMHEHNELSISSLISRTRMIWATIFGIIFLGEVLKPINYLGLIILFLGLSSVVAPKKFFIDKGIKYTTIFSLEVAIYSVLLKMALVDISLPVLILFNAVPAMFVFLFLNKKKKGSLINYAKSKFKEKVAFSVTNLIAFYGWIVAIQYGPVGIVTGIYQGMVIFGVLAGIIFLKERENIARKIIGSIITVVGIFLLVGAI